jgi:ribosomal-protein-alanine N-acetyltransferase
MRRGDGEAVRLRRGREADVDDFVRIWQAIWRHGFAAVLGVDANDPRFIIGAAHGEFIPIARDVIVATLGDPVVGFSYRSRAMIEDLWVDPPFQGQGIGRRLLQGVVDAIAADRYQTASLDCLEANVHARRFYEREHWRFACRHTAWSPTLKRYVPRIRYEFDVWRSPRP